MKQIFVERNDSSIDPCQKLKNDNYHLGQLNRPVSQIDRLIASAIWLVLSWRVTYERIWENPPYGIDAQFVQCAFLGP